MPLVRILHRPHRPKSTVTPVRLSRLEPRFGASTSSRQDGRRSAAAPIDHPPCRGDDDAVITAAKTT
jgi:hypothetical protein